MINPNSITKFRTSHRQDPKLLVEAFNQLADQWDDLCGPGSVLADEFHTHAAFLRGTCERLGRPRVLDIGCGTGRHLVFLAPWIAEGVGIDFAPRMIERARANAAAAGINHVRYATAEASALEQKSLGEFDLILLIGTLEHVMQPAKVLEAARNVLAAGGRVVVIMPHRANLFFLLRRLRRGGNGPVFSSDSMYDVRRLRRLAGSIQLSVEAVHPLPFSIERPGEPTVPLLWRTIAAVLRHVPTVPTRGAFGLVLKEEREDPHVPP